MFAFRNIGFILFILFRKFLSIIRNVLNEKNFIFIVLIAYGISLECYSCADCDDPFDINSAAIIAMNGTGLYCNVNLFLIDIYYYYYIFI